MLNLKNNLKSKKKKKKKYNEGKLRVKYNSKSKNTKSIQ